MKFTYCVLIWLLFCTQALPCDLELENEISALFREKFAKSTMGATPPHLSFRRTMTVSKHVKYALALKTMHESLVQIQYPVTVERNIEIVVRLFGAVATDLNAAPFAISVNVTKGEMILLFSREPERELGYQSLASVQEQREKTRAMKEAENITAQTMRLLHRIDALFQDLCSTKTERVQLTNVLHEGLNLVRNTDVKFRKLVQVYLPKEIDGDAIIALGEHDFGVFEVTKVGKPWLRFVYDADVTLIQQLCYDDNLIIKSIYWLNPDTPEFFKTRINPSIKACVDDNAVLSPIIVTVLDSGVDYNHPQLAKKILRDKTGQALCGYDLMFGTDKPYDFKLFFRSESFLRQYDPIANLTDFAFLSASTTYEEVKEEIPSDYKCHGTGVAGLVVAGTQGIMVFPIRSDFRCGLKNENYFLAIQKAHEAGSRIINISQGSPRREAYAGVQDAIKAFPDMLFIIAAGNGANGVGLDHDAVADYPSSFRFPNTIAVAAHDEHGVLATFSDYGKTTVDLAAPGVAITVLEREANCKVENGTSLSAPFVTRVAAKMMQINPSLTPEGIKQILMDTVDKEPSMVDKIVSEGRINEERALAAAAQTLKN